MIGGLRGRPSHARPARDANADAADVAVLAIDAEQGVESLIRPVEDRLGPGCDGISPVSSARRLLRDR